MRKTQDLTGQKFGKLTAISRTGKKGHNGEIWLCVCACGNTAEVESYNLRTGRVKSCGCGMNAEGDYTGVRRGDLIGIRRTGKTVKFYGREREVWEWQCKCGRRIERALFQVAPRGVSCCPDCMREKQKENCLKTIYEKRVEGTLMTEGQLRDVLEGKLTRSNRSGIRGVSWSKNANKWTARGFKDGKAVHLGYFERIEDAAKARQEFLNQNLDIPIRERENRAEIKERAKQETAEHKAGKPRRTEESTRKRLRRPDENRLRGAAAQVLLAPSEE